MTLKSKSNSSGSSHANNEHSLSLIDLLLEVVRAHGETMHALYFLFGDTVLIEIIDRAGEREPAYVSNEALVSSFYWLQKNQESDDSLASAYAAIEQAVRQHNLPPHLDFYLWAYPLYRLFIESGLHLYSNCKPEKVDDLIDAIQKDAQNWIASLQLPAPFSLQAEGASVGPWRRFRVQILKLIGRRSLDLLN